MTKNTITEVKPIIPAKYIVAMATVGVLGVTCAFGISKRMNYTKTTLAVERAAAVETCQNNAYLLERVLVAKNAFSNPEMQEGFTRVICTGCQKDPVAANGAILLDLNNVVMNDARLGAVLAGRESVASDSVRPTEKPGPVIQPSNGLKF